MIIIYEVFYRSGRKEDILFWSSLEDQGLGQTYKFSGQGLFRIRILSCIILMQWHFADQANRNISHSVLSLILLKNHVIDNLLFSQCASHGFKTMWKKHCIWGETWTGSSVSKCAILTKVSTTIRCKVISTWTIWGHSFSDMINLKVTLEINTCMWHFSIFKW